MTRSSSSSKSQLSAVADCCTACCGCVRSVDYNAHKTSHLCDVPIVTVIDVLTVIGPRLIPLLDAVRVFDVLTVCRFSRMGVDAELAPISIMLGVPESLRV